MLNRKSTAEQGATATEGSLNGSPQTTGLDHAWKMSLGYY